MRRMLSAALIAAIAMLSMATTASAGIGGSTGSPDRVFQRYAKIRDQVYSCVLDQNYRHLGQEKRRACPRLRRLYRLYSFYGSSEFYLFCTSGRRCPAKPEGVPVIRGSIPRGAAVFRP